MSEEKEVKREVSDEEYVEILSSYGQNLAGCGS